MVVVLLVLRLFDCVVGCGWFCDFKGYKIL